MDNGDEEIYYDQMASDWDRKQLCKVASNNLEKKNPENYNWREVNIAGHWSSA
jgi:hypothetical protein